MLLAAGCWLLAAGCLLLSACCWWSAAVGLLLAVCCCCLYRPTPPERHAGLLEHSSSEKASHSHRLNSWPRFWARRRRIMRAPGGFGLPGYAPLPGFAWVRARGPRGPRASRIATCLEDRHVSRGPRGPPRPTSPPRTAPRAQTPQGPPRPGDSAHWGPRAHPGEARKGRVPAQPEPPRCPHDAPPPTQKSRPLVQTMTVRSLLPRTFFERPCVSLWGGWPL
jgi:hypothetical protein